MSQTAALRVSHDKAQTPTSFFGEDRQALDVRYRGLPISAYLETFVSDKIGKEEQGKDTYS
jgi:hypothetical protein